MKQMLPLFQENFKMFLTVFMFAMTSATLFGQNASNGGAITGSQQICPGETPSILTNQTTASGGNVNASIEYLWMSTTIFNNNINSWSAAPGNNSGMNYQPPALAQTTYYARCARRNGFIAFPAESNIVTVTVLNSPTAIINGNPGSGFPGLSIDFNAANAFNGTYSWNFGNGQFGSGQNPNAPTYNAPGIYTVTLTVSNGSCSVTTTSTVVITSAFIASVLDPCGNCGDPLNFTLGPPNLGYFVHDYILINSNPGETWTLNNPIGVLNNSGGALTSGTPIPETAPGSGVYYLNIWFNASGGGWTANVSNGTGAGTSNLPVGPGAAVSCPPCPESPLPVVLTKFEGKQVNRLVTLKWATESEIDNSHFDIEKSIDGVRFESLGSLEGVGTTNETNNYKFNDNNPSNGVNYYRLKQVDFDGEYEYSKIISVKVENENSSISVFPNPVREKTQIQIDAIYPNSFLEIISSTGQVVREIKVENSVQEVFMGDLPSGIYFFRLNNNSIVKNLPHRVTKL